jgi:uncharacterized membrane protein (DUF373 family)
MDLQTAENLVLVGPQTGWRWHLPELKEGSANMPEELEKRIHPIRARLAYSISLVEDIVYVGLGVLLTVTAFSLLLFGLNTFIVALFARALAGQLVGLLDQILLILLVVELLYTVQVSFREHGLLAEPFLVVALIAVIRRVLVLTAEVPKLPEAGEVVFRHAMLELALLAVMIVVLVGSLILLQKHGKRTEVAR